MVVCLADDVTPHACLTPVFPAHTYSDFLVYYGHMISTHPPASLQGSLWSVKVQQLDIQKDKWYIIHQLLNYGTIKELQWLFATYSKKEIVATFVEQPAKMYFKQTYVFVKNYLLSLSQIDLDTDAYVTSISGPVRQRTASSIS
ncbi:hypothetical protein KKB64_02330 [Patescibacteria group bacterium]|nr:hypothetical protein [Patescibacteria group bacterium]MBU1472606.1 hypothetical protein [Patescibacteria group bacterium]MBU2459857.1 hypothetical protein [Patescibacteria group bacterium]MBU2544082.1 hypothetical protein [Patescibacteria group bacterium]